MNYWRCRPSKCAGALEPRKSLRSSSWKHRSLGSRRSIRQSTRSTDFARARKIAMGAESAAHKAEQLGLVHGLPTGIKDLHETAGLLTTYGSPLLLQRYRPQLD